MTPLKKAVLKVDRKQEIRIHMKSHERQQHIEIMKIQNFTIVKTVKINILVCESENREKQFIRKIVIRKLVNKFLLFFFINLLTLCLPHSSDSI